MTSTRTRVITAGIAVILAVTAVLLWTSHRAHQRDLDDWHATEAAWAAQALETLEAVRPDGGATLGEQIDGLAMEYMRVTPDGAEPDPEARDALAASCSTVTAGLEALDASPDAPALPQPLAGTDETDEVTAWNEYRDAAAGHLGTLQSFCGIYLPLVSINADAEAAGTRLRDVLTDCDEAGCLPPPGTDMAPHADDLEAFGAGASQARADLLGTGCYLADLAAACTADAAHHRALAPLQQDWQAALLAGDLAAAREAAQAITAQNASDEEAFAEAADQIEPGSTRDSLAELTTTEVTETEEALATATEELRADLGRLV